MAETLTSRITTALAVLRGRPDATRAVLPMSTPGTTLGTLPPGAASAALVRTANPQEYKPDGATIRTQGFGKHPVVHACIRVVADLVASVPLVVLRERGDGESRIGEAHPLQRLLDYPGPRFTARALRARLAVDFLGYGNALIQMERRGRQGRPVGLRSINPESLQSVWVDSEGDPRRYDYGNWAGIIVQVPAESVIHVKDLEMSRPFTPDVFGFPRGATAIASMTADNEATQYVRQVVTNDGTPTFAVLLADEATQDDAAAMQDRYRARVVDRGKRGTPAFFGAVKDIKPLGFTLSDLEFPDLRRVSREDICAAFGVDPRMIGIASASNDAGLSGAQYVEARARLVQHTIEPMLAAIEDELNHWLAPEFGDVWIAFDADVLRDLVENDETTSKRVRDEFTTGLRSWEESRRALKLSPIPDPTDTIALSAGVQLVPAATAVIDPRTIMEPAAPVPVLEAEVEPETDDDEDEEDDDDDDQLEPTRADVVRTDVAPALVAVGAGDWWDRLTPDELAQEPRYQTWARAMDELNRREVPWYQAARDQFATEREQVGALFEPGGLRAFKTSAEILAEIERRIREGYRPGGDYYEAWRAAYEALIGELYMVGARQVAGVGLSFSLQSPEVLQAITNRAARLAELVGETTAQGILSAIRAAQLAGLSVKETGRLVQASVFNEQISDRRATVIARTESAGAMAQGTYDQAEAMPGVYRSKEWLAFEDAKTRPTHTACMRQGRIAWEATFTNGLRYPHDPRGTAAEVIQCRCVLAPNIMSVDEGAI
jgi:HK97 family phage portal protein